MELCNWILSPIYCCSRCRVMAELMLFFRCHLSRVDRSMRCEVLMMTRHKSKDRLRPLLRVTLLTFKFQLDCRVSIWNCGFFHYVHYVKCWGKRVVGKAAAIPTLVQSTMCHPPRMLKGKIFKLDCCGLIQFTRYWWWTRQRRIPGEWDQNEAEKEASTVRYCLDRTKFG